MSRVTLQEIADHLGISKFAVSRALTGKSGVSEETRRAVIGAAEKFGYTARRSRAPMTAIEVIFHDRNVANREIWIDVQHGIEMEATRSGYSMAVRWTSDHQIIGRLEESAAGFILVGPQEPEMFEAARDCAVPAVIVSHIVPELYRMDQIAATDVEAGVFVGKYLAGLGHRRLVYAHGQLGYPGRHARMRGFAEAVADIPGAELREIAFQEDYMAAGFHDSVMRLVESGFEPTAFFCGSDGVAVTVVSELMRMGLRVPEDVSVVGHADYPIATQISPNLTTIHMPHRQMGIAAVRQLLARAGVTDVLDDLPPQRVSLVPHLVERQSTGPVPERSWKGKLRSNSSAAV
jgi:LacI family transcriptional regulator